MKMKYVIRLLNLIGLSSLMVFGLVGCSDPITITETISARPLSGNVEIIEVTITRIREEVDEPAFYIIGGTENCYGKREETRIFYYPSTGEIESAETPVGVRTSTTIWRNDTLFYKSQGQSGECIYEAEKGEFSIIDKLCEQTYDVPKSKNAFKYSLNDTIYVSDIKSDLYRYFTWGGGKLLGGKGYENLLKGVTDYKYNLGGFSLQNTSTHFFFQRADSSLFYMDLKIPEHTFELYELGKANLGDFNYITKSNGKVIAVYGDSESCKELEYDKTSIKIIGDDCEVPLPIIQQIDDFEFYNTDTKETIKIESSKKYWKSFDFPVTDKEDYSC